MKVRALWSARFESAFVVVTFRGVLLRVLARFFTLLNYSCQGEHFELLGLRFPRVLQFSTFSDTGATPDWPKYHINRHHHGPDVTIFVNFCHHILVQHTQAMHKSFFGPTFVLAIAFCGLPCLDKVIFKPNVTDSQPSVQCRQ